MEQALIDRMWAHTRQVEAENARRIAVVDPEVIRAWREGRISSQMPADLILHGASKDLYLSFHPEASNANRHSHDFFELLYACRGAAVGEIDGQEVRLAEGSLCIMNPNATHWFRSYEEARDLVLNIVLPKDVFQRTVFRVLFTDPALNAFFLRHQLDAGGRPAFLFLPHLDRDVDAIVGMLMKDYLDPARYSPVVRDSLLALLFASILRAYGESTRTGRHAADEVVAYVDRNHRTATLSEVAARFGYHPKYLSSLLHRATGQTFRTLVASLKLQNAANCLLFTDDPVDRIAALVGYQDTSAFYAGFKAKYGMSPAEYRRAHG